MTQEEHQQYLLSLISQITATTDPLQEELGPWLKEYGDKQNRYEYVTSANNALTVVTAPDKSQRPGCFLHGLIVIAFIIIFLILGASFEVSLEGAIGASLMIYFLRFIIYKEHVSEYKKYVQTKTDYENELVNLKNEMDDILETIKPNIEVRCEVLRLALNKSLGIPYPKSVISMESYPKIKKCYLNLLKEKEDVDNISDPNEQAAANRAFINDKLSFLYAHSLRATVSDEVYGEFKQQFLNADPGKMLMRQEIREQSSKGYCMITNLPKYKEMLYDDRLSPIISQFNAVSRRRTRGVFFEESTDKKTAQTQDMAKLCEAAKYEYDELMKLNKYLSYALNYARGCAFRNIYLATELINYVVVGSNRGGGLTTANDEFNLSEINQSFKIDTSDLNISSAAVAMCTIGYMSTTFMNNASLTQFADNNPKVMTGIFAVAALSAAISQHYENIEANAEAQRKLAENISKIADGYTEGKGNMLRVLEIISGIVKCNDGFMAVYEPLKKRVFEEGNTDLTKMEIMQLAAAANEYSKTAKAQIK